MPAWAIWVIAAAALAAGEALTLGFLLGPVALAALLAALVAVLGGGVQLQLGAFIGAAIASVLVLRPVARAHRRTPQRLRTGTAALVGASATVVERVHEGGGLVRIGSETWTARPFDEDAAYEAGVRVEVLRIEGATAVVSE
jgi:membrane protein implicated in regulation of membrane protease activity